MATAFQGRRSSRAAVTAHAMWAGAAKRGAAAHLPACVDNTGRQQILACLPAETHQLGVVGGVEVDHGVIRQHMQVAL